MKTLDEYLYCVYSSSLDLKIQIKIGSLKGVHPVPEYNQILADPMIKFSGLHEKSSADLMVECQVFSGGRPISLPVYTAHKAPSPPFSTRCDWITLPLKYSDLPRDALLAITLYDCVGAASLKPVGGTTISFFSKHGVFRQGMIDLRVWPDCVADGSPQSSTPGKACHDGKKQIIKLAKLAKKHRDGHLPEVDWLDRLAFCKIEHFKELEKRSSDYLYLMVEFPEFTYHGTKYSVIFYEQDGDELYQFRDHPDIVLVPDSEVLQENLVENKHHNLTRSLHRGISDKDAKPNAIIRDKLNAIVAYPPTKQLTTEEQDYIWKYRFYLSTQKQALAKFLYCVNWELTVEARQAVDMLQQWAPMAVEDSLQLLSPAFNHPAVRRYAISRLQQASDDDLLLYLLQLVQALKYEDFYEINEAYKKMQIKDSYSSDGEQKEMSVSCMSKSHDSLNSKSNSDLESEDKNLATFLIQRACHNCTLANYFYWYLITECEDQEVTVEQETKVREMYLTVMRMFQETLQNGPLEWQKQQQVLQKQVLLVDELVKLVKSVQRENTNRKKKIEQLQMLLADSEAFKINLADFDPMPFPLDPRVCIRGIVPNNAILFKSALMPLRLTFKTTEGSEYVALFKHGDDLRQDQFVLQIITLMDKLLRSENLDLRLTPYRVLATGTKHGFVQFINSLTIAEVLTSEGSIQSFLRKRHPSENSPYGIAPDIMDTYIRSCAGYCVITYILGVGDRHLDNLLLTTTGKLFHIDFGYILGRDPKPFPPPMKLSKEMVEAMGGTDSEYYHEFRKLCYTAYLHLRRNANVILNLFSLMVNANVPDIALEPDKALKKVQDKLRLDLGDEEAVQYFKHLLDISVTAVMAILVDQLHKFAQYWRN
ncbi:phosphatidylinositol 3-kinase catalytic subunit type 3 [Macrosteles quadrilineatus]|uniref:phosphatidylinositol 3-kinase catalytic subunit type 3 n=1 Tax=Macrosteles quadrilineatus TaxID=74068 RepID=UPI0023E1AAB7|nr:phosphatidylinositol 3-kinase catalytic subunit type 3 [Macrosteles quadrilineatus]